MRKALIVMAAFVAVTAVLWLWPRKELGLTPATETDGDFTVAIERFEIWTERPPPSDTPPLWIRRLRSLLGVRNREREFYSVFREKPAAEGTRSGWVRLTVTGPGAAGYASAVQVHLLTEDPPDRTPMGSGSHSLSLDSLLIDADFVIAGDGAINGLKVTVGEKTFLFKAR